MAEENKTESQEVNVDALMEKISELESYKKKLNNENAERRLEIKRLQEELNKYKSDLTVHESEKDKYKSELESYKQQLEEFRKQEEQELEELYNEFPEDLRETLKSEVKSKKVLKELLKIKPQQKQSSQASEIETIIQKASKNPSGLSIDERMQWASADREGYEQWVKQSLRKAVN